MQKKPAHACHRFAKPAACGLVWLLRPLASEHRWCALGTRCANCSIAADGPELAESGIQAAAEPDWET